MYYTVNGVLPFKLRKRFCHYPKAILTSDRIIGGCRLTARSPEGAHHRPIEHWWLSEDNE